MTNEMTAAELIAFLQTVAPETPVVARVLGNLSHYASARPGKSKMYRTTHGDWSRFTVLQHRNDTDVVVIE